MNKDGVVRRRQVGPGSAFVTAEKQEYSCVMLLQVFLLEFIERSGLLVHGTLEFERLDASLVQR